jgi:hypothetical protein
VCSTSTCTTPVQGTCWSTSLWPFFWFGLSLLLITQYPPFLQKVNKYPPLQAIAGLLSHRRPNPVLHRTQCCTRPKPMPRHTFAPSAPYFCPHYNTLLSTPLGTYHWLLPWRRTATLRLLPRVRLLLPVLSHVLLPNLYLMLWIIYHRCI